VRFTTAFWRTHPNHVGFRQPASPRRPSPQPPLPHL
jgi:hypothetical protein